MRTIALALIAFLPGCASMDWLNTHEDGVTIEITRDKTAYEDLIIRHEGYRRHPYPDAGGLAVGYGRNLTNNGINEAEARFLLRSDLARVSAGLTKRFPVADRLDSARYAAVLSMGYNLGLDGLASFKKMWTAIEHGQYVRASSEMMLSDWCGQVGKRCIELADMMATGKWK